jgi:hypothetical protein
MLKMGELLRSPKWPHLWLNQHNLSFRGSWPHGLMWLVLRRLFTEHKLPTGFFGVLTGFSIYEPCDHHVNGWNNYITFKWMDETIHHLRKHWICIWFCPSSCRICVVGQSSMYMTVTILIGRSWTSMVDYAW